MRKTITIEIERDERGYIVRERGVTGGCGVTKFTVGHSKSRLMAKIEELLTGHEVTR